MFIFKVTELIVYFKVTGVAQLQKRGGSLDMSWLFGRTKGTSAAATEVVPEPYNPNLCEVCRSVARRDSIEVSCPVSLVHSVFKSESPGADDHNLTDFCQSVLRLVTLLIDCDS